MDLNELYLDAFGGDKSPDSDDVIPSELDTDDDEISEDEVNALNSDDDLTDSPEENEDDE